VKDLPVVVDDDDDDDDVMKFSRAISRVKWLSGEQTNVSKTISVPRVLV
jgi:hypothetical protein